MTTATPTQTRTAPLPPAAAAAMARLEVRLVGRSVADVLAHEAASHVRVTSEVHKAVVRYEIAKATFDRLSAMDARDMTGYQFTLMAESQDEMAERRAFLESADQLHRIEMA